MSALDRFRDGLQGVTGGGNSFKARCPAHEDAHASLSVSYRDGKVLVHCFAGCTVEPILDSLGLGYADLFDEELTPKTAQVVRSYLYEKADGGPWFWKDRLWPKSFRLRLPGTEPGDYKGIGKRQMVLYHLPRLLKGISEGATIYLVDGEKDVESFERQGQYATCSSASAGADWRPEYTACLRGAKEVVIVADQDKIKENGRLGTGHQYAMNARNSLRAAGVPVKIVAPVQGKDATDHFKAGLGVEDFVKDKAVIFRPRGMTGQELIEADFAPLVFCIDGLLPSGLAILAGSPKCGKTWTAMDMGLAVALGGLAMSSMSTTQGNVLYLAREDGYRRVQSRLDLLLQGTADDLSPFEVISAEHDWPGGEQGLAAMTEWYEEVDRPRLVVLDTLAKVEPQMDDNRDRYRSDYSMMSAYKTWADRHDVTVLMVHHDRKGDADGGDVFTRISGTKGITGAADTLLFLDTKRGTKEGKLHVTGRDVAEQEIELHRSGPIWLAMTAAEVVYGRPRLVQ